MAFVELADDLATLAKLDEQTMVEQLHLRYDEDKIYTYIGDILVAVNPFRQLPIYTPEVQRDYRRRTKLERAPHVYAVADAAYHYMLETSENQCCLISGESGAGKTESAKYVIKQIISLCNSEGMEAGRKVEQQILAVNPLLEAFGNAQTIMNDNSSRFGKYTELIFDGYGQVIGAQISEYLLEKSRVVRQQEGEQNFHILYYLFSSPEREKYGLSHPTDYKYLSNIEDVDMDSDEMFVEVVGALETVGFSPAERDMVFKILASVMHIGHIEFKSGSELAPASIDASSRHAIDTVAQLLEFDVKQFEQALTLAITITRGETIKRQYTKAQALDNRDAMAKALYGRLFSWLVSNINALLHPPEAKASRGPPGAMRDKTNMRFSIGILDIFGFEDFAVNSFEQMCINLANEHLQHFFNQHVFELEQEEYSKEGIDGTKITYVDNTPLLEMFTRKPLGILALLDEESYYPRATDETLVNKFNQHFGNEKHYAPDRGNRPVFTIHHYAGDVLYHGAGFLEKNRDTLAPDTIACLQGSGIAVVSELFFGTVTDTGSLEPFNVRHDSINTRQRKVDQAKKDFRKQLASAAAENTANKRPETVGSQYKHSLQLLIEKMRACRPHFIRCIKPNTAQEPWNFQDEFVMVQLNYTGMLETTRIRREGYAVRPKFAEFIERFRPVAFGFRQKVEPIARNCITILDSAGISGWLMGKTKLFLKYYHLEELEAVLLRLQRMSMVVQKWWRGYSTRKWTDVLLAALREQRAKAEKFLQQMSSDVGTMSARCKELANEDVRRFKDRRAQMVEESKRQAVQRRKNLEEREAREREEVEQNRKQLEADYNRVQQDVERLQGELQQRVTSNQDTTVVSQELEAKLREREELLRRKLKEQREVVNQMRLELNESQRVLNNEQTQRDVAVRQLLAKVTKGGPGAASAIDSLNAKLRAQDDSLQEGQFQVAQLSERLDVQAKLLDTYQDQHAAILRKLNEFLSDNSVSSAAVQVERRKIESEMEARMLEQTQAMEATKAESQRAVGQIKEVLQMAEAEVADLTAKLETQRTLLNTKQSEQNTLISDLKAQLAAKEDEIIELKAEHERAIRALESRMRTAQANLESQLEEKDGQIQQLQMDLRHKETLLQTARREKETIALELETKVEMGEAEAEAQLRLRLRTVEQELEDAQAELAKEKSRFASQSSLLDISKTSNAAMINDLKRVLDEKETVAQNRINEQEKMIRDLNAKYREQIQKMDKVQADHDDELTQLQIQLRKRERQMQTEIADAEERNNSLMRQVQIYETSVKDMKKDILDKDMKLEELNAEASSAKSKLTQQTAMYDTAKQETQRALDNLQRSLQEKEVMAESSKNEHERAMRALEAELESVRQLLEQRAEEHQQLLQEQYDEFTNTIQTLEKEVTSRDSEYEELAGRRHALETECEQLRTARDEAVGEKETMALQINDLMAQLQDLKTANESALEAGRAEAEAARRAAEEELGAQGKKRKAAHEKLLKAIRAMGRQPPNSGTPGEDKDVDLLQFMTFELNGQRIPHDMSLSRFACRGYLSKLAGKHWQKRWFVFDLESKTLSWYVDNREMRISVKGTIPLQDITKTILPPGPEAAGSHSFLVATARRSYHLRATTPATKRAWIQVINAIAAGGK